MGWIAVYRNGKIEKEDDPGVGRPVQAGENGELMAIAQEDYGNKVAIDLINGIILIGYDAITVQNGTVEVQNPKTFLRICEETNIVGDYRHRTETEPDGAGNYTIDYHSLVWRPIWFSRITNGVATKIIGTQTTTPTLQGEKNVKKLISLFSDGTVGID